ncbi:MAG: hypothetical protein ACM3RX_07635, partial [Methanococcaceae archaeon]
MLNPINTYSGDYQSLLQVTDRAFYLKQTGEATAITQDSAFVSDISRNLFASQLDISQSNASKTDSLLDFSLSFGASSSEKLTASGYYNTSEKKFSLSMKYSFQKTIDENGTKKTKNFVANIDLKANVKKDFSAESVNNKEDIVDFVRRMVDDVLKFTNDDTKLVKGVVLGEQDIKEIASLSNGEIGKMIIAIISTAIFASQMKSLNKNGKKLENV